MGCIPNDLDRGILLERGDLLIPWGTSIGELSRFRSPSVLEREDSIHFTWKDQLCLGGLPCHVGACRVFGRPDPLAYHLHLKEFHFALLEIVSVLPPADIGAEFRRVFRHLEDALGAPSWSYPKYEAGLPSIH